MSTKGMSTTAARLLLDRLAPQLEKVLVLHDFDVSGFSIFGTLSTDGRRYQFENDPPIVDIGFRLIDVEAMSLQSEPVETQGGWSSRSATLSEHGATPREIDFLQKPTSASAVLPENLGDKVRSMFKEKPELSWDTGLLLDRRRCRLITSRGAPCDHTLSIRRESLMGPEPSIPT